MQRARTPYERECADQGRAPAPTFLVDLRFHDLRHEATSRLASCFQLHELAKITARMLLRYYHPTLLTAPNGCADLYSAIRKR
ncbi:hypothetical protein FHW69_003059 [Luteibacter sp. Sphag1AF]|uniref:hypothetical protein n=1 Tax=Luteibacter sp. Sphag1AF TaxID=2587031 RepID=UPI001613F7C8|nr:hypothetical protein [Luteibacter sp. Sphag1AF]MBB3228424.1 hypothetical protein [Luteibacter sp. Sphag1AF]